MQKENFVVRAIDVGYGHIKFTDGHDPVSGLIRTEVIPSQSPAVAVEAKATGDDSRKKKLTPVLSKRDTFIVPVNGVLYEVGRDIHMAIHGNHESEVMDSKFPSTDVYAARLYGALNYMLPSLPGRNIDILVLGLPMNTFSAYRSELEERFTGTHVINEAGTAVTIKCCIIYPQPLGSYAAYLIEMLGSAPLPMALVVDPGYNTVDWFVCKGMVANELRSGAVLRGVGQMLRPVASEIIRRLRIDATPAEIVRLVDRGLVTDQKLELYSSTYEIKDFLWAGKSIVTEAAQAIKNSVGSGADINVIVVTGGGAALYAPAIATHFPSHKVVTLSSPATANVRGFHELGEQISRSRMRAMQACGAVSA
jgi:plasmid segregation protein ParM